MTIFDVEGVVHYGIAGNANPSLHIGDVAIPQSWSHTALWNWQVYIFLSDRFDNIIKTQDKPISMVNNGTAEIWTRA